MTAVLAFSLLAQPAQVLHDMPSYQEWTAAHSRAEAEAHVEVFQWSDGSFGVSDPRLGIKVEARKPFHDDFDYRLTGSVASEGFDGEARSRAMRDPSWGYDLRGEGYDLRLQKFGNDWEVRGSYDLKDASGRLLRQNLNVRLARRFPDYNFEVTEEGFNLVAQTTTYSARLDGTYDPALHGPRALALLGVAVALVNQPSLRPPQTPPSRP